MKQLKCFNVLSVLIFYRVFPKQCVNKNLNSNFLISSRYERFVSYIICYSYLCERFSSGIVIYTGFPVTKCMEIWGIKMSHTMFAIIFKLLHLCEFCHNTQFC